MNARALVALCLAAAPAAAYHAPTHAGLTERAALASSLHRRLVERLARPLGLYEPLKLAPDGALTRRLRRLDPEGGYAPDGDKQTALAWLVAGAVLEGVPAERTRHHFFDPATSGGLAEGGSAIGFRTRVAAAASGIGTLRGVFTGASFDGTGRAATEWATAADNEWGLARFLDARVRAATAKTPAERDAALAEALLAAGALLHLVEDAGDPAHVRNDYREALDAAGGPLERVAATELGRIGVPEPDGAPIARAHLVELFHDRAGNGLADRTQRRFFSAGTLPSTERYPQPSVTAGSAPTGYVRSDDVAHLVGYRRAPDGGIIWILDDRCYRDYAHALLPEIGRYAAGAIELLFRGQLELALDGGIVTATAREVGLGSGDLELYGDTANGERRRLLKQRIAGADPGSALATVERPAWARKVAAVFRGVDAAGEPLVVVQETLLPR
jgi:hypothetical protein